MNTQSSIPNGLSEEQNINIANLLNLIGEKIIEAFIRGEELIILSCAQSVNIGVMACLPKSKNFKPLINNIKKQIKQLEDQNEKHYGVNAEIIENEDKTILIKFKS